jgi:hypothetical protein
MKAPDPVVAQVHPLLALPRGLHQRAVGLDHRFLEEGIGLLPPDSKTGLVDGLHQPFHVVPPEPATEVPSGRGIRNPLCPEGIEIHLVVAKEFQVFQTAPAGQHVVGEVQDVVRLVIGQVDLEQVQATVDLLHQPRRLGQLLNRAEAPHPEAARPFRHLVVDVRRPEHRLFLVAPVAVAETVLDAALAVAEIPLCTLLHSKCPLCVEDGLFALPSYRTETGLSRPLA